MRGEDLIGRNTKSDIDLAREKLFLRNTPPLTIKSEPVSEQLHIVNSFQEVSPLHETVTKDILPAVNFQLFTDTNSVDKRGIIDSSKYLDFLIIFINWPGDEQKLQDAFKDIIKQKVPLRPNNQNQTVEVNTHSISEGDHQKNMLILEDITEHTSGIFIFDFEAIEEDQYGRLDDFGHFALNSNFNIDHLRERVKEIKQEEKILLGLFSDSIQSNILANEYLLRDFITDEDNCFSSIILPSSYYPGEFNMCFELAGIMQSIINFLSNTQDYRESINDAQNEIFLRCIENNLPKDEITASACSIYFGFEFHNIFSKNKITEFPISEELPCIGIFGIDNAIQPVDTFASDECQKLEKQIYNAVYASLRGMNILSKELNEYHKLLFSIVIGTQSSIWENPQSRKILKNEDRIKKLWDSFCSEEQPSIIGKETYGENTTEGQILYGFRKSIRQIQQNRGIGSSLIYRMITKGQDNVEDPLETLERLKDGMKGNKLNFGDAVMPQIHPITLLLDENILKYLHNLYLSCKHITHMPEILKQAPIDDKYEYLFISSKEKNIINKILMKNILTQLKDAIQAYYPDGLSYTASTAMFRETSLQWWVGD